MAVAYISMALLYTLEVISYPEKPGIKLNQFITLTNGAFQAFLFTYMFISLINLHFVTIKKVLLEIAAILVLSIALASTLVFPSLQYLFNTVLPIYIAYYLLMLVRYIITFLKEYRRYRFHADNFYSEERIVHFRWIYYSFFAALIIGTGALLLSFTDNVLHYVIFTVVFIMFYFYFGIRFINYAFLFYAVAPVLVVNEESTKTNEWKDNNGNFYMMEDAISQWVAQEKYLQFGLTLKVVAKELKTNRTYLSNYINTSRNQTFREWINYLRIEKSKEILLLYSDIPIKEIATITGYGDYSNFNKQFLKFTGISAQRWRKKSFFEKKALKDTLNDSGNGKS